MQVMAIFVISFSKHLATNIKLVDTKHFLITFTLH